MLTFDDFLTAVVLIAFEFFRLRNLLADRLLNFFIACRNTGLSYMTEASCVLEFSILSTMMGVTVATLLHLL